MMRPSQEAALVAFADRFDGVPFAVGGSALMALVGADVEPRDLDVVVGADLLELVRARAGNWWRGLTEVESHPVIDSAWLALLDVDGEPVEVMGGLALVSDGVRWEMPIRDGGTADVAGRLIPLAPIGQWVALYSLLRPSRALELAPFLSADEKRQTTRELPTGFGIEWPTGNAVV